MERRPFLSGIAAASLRGGMRSVLEKSRAKAARMAQMSGATVTYHDPQGNSFPGHSTNFVSSSQPIDPAFNNASDAGTWTVQVVNPGSVTSNTFSFTVK